MVSTHGVKLSLAATELKQPLHVKVRQILREQILNDFQHGQRFYTERELMKKLEVSQATVRRAVQDLVTEGYLLADPRKGLFVKQHADVRYVGLIAPTWASRLEEAYSDYAQVCRRHDYILNVYGFPKDETVDNIVKQIRNKPSEERIIVSGLTVELTLQVGSRLQAEGYQHAVVGARVAGSPGGSVSLDHEGEVNQVLDYLTEMGHERILFMVNEPRNLLITSLRAEAVEKKLAERKLPHAELVYCDTRNWESSYDAAYQKMREIMQKQPAPTAIVPLSGVGAWAVLRYAIEHEIKVPRQLSIISFDPMANASILPIPMTELMFSHEEMAEQALRLLWSEHPSLMHELVAPKLVPRSSVARLK
jgi:LacI family transcriptional regulator